MVKNTSTQHDRNCIQEKVFDLYLDSLFPICEHYGVELTTYTANIHQGASMLCELPWCPRLINNFSLGEIP